MPLVGGLLVAAVAAGLVLAARLRVAFVTLIAVTFLVPSELVAPNGMSSFLTTNRVVVVAFLVGMALRVRRGEVPAAVFRVTRVHVALAALAVTGLVVGVGLAPAGTPSLTSLHDWAVDADAVLFFVAALAAIRAIGDAAWVARVVAVVVLLSAGVAVGEHFTGGSWARWWFHSQRSQLGSLPAVPLESRLGSVRVRAAEPFALAFGWICAVVLPLVVASVGRLRGRRVLVGVAATGVLVMAMYWSLSRSPFVGVLVGAAVLLAGSRLDRRVVPYVGAGVVAALLVWAAAPHVYDSLMHLVPAGSVQVRLQRLHIALDAAASRPYLGVGFGGLASYNVPTTDATYLLTYSSLGVTGLAVLAVTLVTAVASAAGALRAPAGPRRALAAGAFAGVVMALVGAAAYDLFSEITSQEVFWLLVAFCVVLAEETRAVTRLTVLPGTMPAAAPARSPRLRLAAGLAVRVAVVPLAALAGAGIGHIPPSHAALEFDFGSVPAQELSPALSDQVYLGKQMGASACSVLTGMALPPGSSLYCEQQPAPGFAYVRLQAPTTTEVQAEAQEGTAVLSRHFPGFRPHLLLAPAPSRPTWARTAPVWMALLGLGLALLAPRPSRIRARLPELVRVPLSRIRLAPA